jgi:hypothetical protein
MKRAILLGTLLVAGCASAPKSTMETMEKVGIRVAGEPIPECQSGHDSALANGILTIRPGDIICVSLETDGASVSPAVVVASANPKDTLVVKFWQEPGTSNMFLSVHNPLSSFLQYRAEILRPGSLQYEYTSSCPVLAHLMGLENWPFPIAELGLSNFKLLPDSKAIECK